MNKMLEEILEIPMRAKELWNSSSRINLPLKVPYLGMGSSFFAPLAFKYMGVEIYPESAAEFFYYLAKNKKFSAGVILSQSGRSSEALWCSQFFDSFIAISNHPSSALSTAPNVSAVIDIMAGEEQYSSSKTYINTLLALFSGLGFDATEAIQLLEKKMPEYQKKGKELADRVFERISKTNVHGIYILGSGPNISTALEAALILSESTKRNFHGLSMAQYDHGPKETAAGSIVIQIISKGASYERTVKLTETIIKAGAVVFIVEEPDVQENYSILHNILPFNFMAYYLAQRMGIGDTFVVGNKVTESM